MPMKVQSPALCLVSIARARVVGPVHEHVHRCVFIDVCNLLAPLALGALEAGGARRGFGGGGVSQCGVSGGWGLVV